MNTTSLHRDDCGAQRNTNENAQDERFGSIWETRLTAQPGSNGLVAATIFVLLETVRARAICEMSEMRRHADCETLIVHRAELEDIVTATGIGAVKDSGYVVLGTISRRSWRRGLIGDARLVDIRQHVWNVRPSATRMTAR